MMNDEKITEWRKVHAYDSYSFSAIERVGVSGGMRGKMEEIM